MSAYLKLRGDGPSFLLESAEQGQRFGRWSFLGFRPRAVIRLAPRGDAPPTLRGAWPRSSRATGSRRSTGCRRSPAARSGCSATTWCAPPSRRSASPNPDDVGVPDLALMVSDVLLAFDHLRHEVTVLANVFAGGDVERAYARRGGRDRGRARAAAPGRSRAPAAARARAAGVRVEHGRRRLRRGGRAREGVHPRRRHLPGGPEPALERGLPGGGVLDLPRPARGQPEPVHVLPRLRGLRDRRRLAGVAREGHRARACEQRPIAGTRPRGDTAEEDLQQRATSCSPTRRSAPST